MIQSNDKDVSVTSEQKKRGFFLKYQDFKKLERIIEDYNLDAEGNIDFNNMKTDEKDILWKIKTVIRNMESVRLRSSEESKNHD